MWLSVFAYLCAVAHGSVLVGVLVSSPGFAGAYLAGRVLSVPAMAWVSRQSVGRQATAVWLSTLFQALTVYAFPGPGNDGLLAIALALVCGLTTMATGPMLEKGRELPHGHSLASARVSEYRRQTACTWVGLGCGGVGAASGYVVASVVGTTTTCLLVGVGYAIDLRRGANSGGHDRLDAEEFTRAADAAAALATIEAGLEMDEQPSIDDNDSDRSDDDANLPEMAVRADTPPPLPDTTRRGAAAAFHADMRMSSLLSVALQFLALSGILVTRHDAGHGLAVYAMILACVVACVGVVCVIAGVSVDRTRADKSHMLKIGFYVSASVVVTSIVVHALDGAALALVLLWVLALLGYAACFAPWVWASGAVRALMASGEWKPDTAVRVAGYRGVAEIVAMAGAVAWSTAVGDTRTVHIPVALDALLILGAYTLHYRSAR